MVKAGKWIKSILIGSKKDKEKRKSTNYPCAVITENSTTPAVIPPTTPKEKKRWSFRRSSATAPGPKDSNSTAAKTGPVAPANVESPDSKQKQPELSAAEIMIHVKAPSNANARSVEELSAAIKIQSVFRSYLARKALRALRGLVKLQALARGHLVRKRATATLRCMQALLTAQARARAQRIRCVDNNHRHSTCRINGDDLNFKNSYYEVEKGMMEENVKIVEMDLGELKGSSKTRNNYTYYQNSERRDDRFSTHYASDFDYIKQEYQKISPAPSAITDISPRTFSGHFEDYSFNTAQSSPHCYAESYDYPNYMANTKSSRAKVRSQSAPKQRPESFERQPSRRRPSVEGRNIPRAVRMQRSSSHLSATAQNYNYPWSIKLDKSMVSLKDSECGSTCSVLTTANNNRSGIPYDVSGSNYKQGYPKDSNFYRDYKKTD